MKTGHRCRLSRTDYEEAFDNVCCQCGEIMPPEEYVSISVKNDEVVCIHCKRDYFVEGQPFRPPMTHDELLRNVEYGISIPSGSKVRGLEQRRLNVLVELGGGDPEELGPPGAHAGGPETRLPHVERSSEMHQGGSHEASTYGVAIPWSSSGGKRTIAEIGEPPGLGGIPVDSKVRRTQITYALDIQNHVEILQQVIQRFDIQITNGTSQEMQGWVSEIWSVLGEVANHLHSVSHFASRGFEQQGLHCQSLQQSVDMLFSEIRKCATDLKRINNTEETLQKQYEQLSILRRKVEKIQTNMSSVLSLLDGVRTPLTEAFSGIYHDRGRVDALTHRVEQLENLGVHASDQDLQLDGVPASDNSMYAQLDSELKQVIHAIWGKHELEGAKLPIRH
eukprot:4892680-Amphidinium_carterae.1